MRCASKLNHTMVVMLPFINACSLSLSAFPSSQLEARSRFRAETREKLSVQPGDTLRYRITGDRVLLNKAPAIEADDPLTTAFAHLAFRRTDRTGCSRGH